MSKPSKDEQAVELSSEDLGELAAQLKALVEVKDRAYGFPARTYEHCFVGSEAVAAMVARGMAADADDALRIGNLLLGAGVLRHVLGEHPPCASCSTAGWRCSAEMKRPGLRPLAQCTGGALSSKSGATEPRAW